MYRSPFTKAGHTCGSAFKQKGTMWSCGYHTGEDWYCNSHALVSPADGIIQRNRWDKSYGNYIVIKTEDNRVILMAHMASKAIPPEGSRISAGDPVGTMGTTGNSTGIHLHVEVEDSATWAYNSNLLKPGDYINFESFSAVPEPAPSGSYKVGDDVTFSTCYASSDAQAEKNIPASKMARNHGIITRIAEGARNPYLLDGGLCWVNDGDIRGCYGRKRIGTVATNSMNLNLRQKPNGAITSSIPKGTQVEILDESGGWCQVQTNGLTGWCSAQYIK